MLNYKKVSQGSVASTNVSGFTQVEVLTSRTINVPAGTKRIEALVCGGGGAGSSNGAGFGGAAVIEIPITGYALDIVVGAGGITPNQAGSPSIVYSAGIPYAIVGGGGAPNGAGPGGSGGGGSYGINNSGGDPPIGKLLWSIYPNAEGDVYSYNTASTTSGQYVKSGLGGVTPAMASNGKLGSLGAGSSGAYVAAGGTAVFGGGGHAGPGGAGAGGGPTYVGGSLESVSIWGYKGKAGGAGASGLGGGGGGLIGVGTTPVVGVTPGHGGLGGGGAGGGGAVVNSVTVYATGGNGFVALRFYS